jgi:glycosyltransferase involved in cell wall biosynthesis
MSDILLSVTLICYNHERFIKQAIESVLEQETNFNFEILIADDASTDNSKAIIEYYANKFSDKIIPIFRDNNIGARMNGIDARAKAKGKYIAYLDGDDYWNDKSKLQKQVDFMENNPEYSYCYHPWQIYNEESQKFGSKIYYNDRIIGLVFRNIINEFPIQFLNVPNGDNFMKFMLSTYGKSKLIKNIKPAIHRHHKGGVWSLTSEEYKLKSRLKTTEKLLEAYYSSIYKTKLKNDLVKILIDIKSYKNEHKVKIIEDSHFSYLRKRKLLYRYLRYRLVLYKVKLLSYFKK